MSIYPCNDCKRKFNKKSHLVNHLNKKNKCKPIINEIPEKYPENIQNIPKIAHFLPQNIQNYPENQGFLATNLVNNQNASNLQNIHLNPAVNSKIPCYIMDENNIQQMQNIPLNPLPNNQNHQNNHYLYNGLNQQNTDLKSLVNNQIPYYIVNSNNNPSLQNIQFNPVLNNQIPPFINYNNTNINHQNIPLNPLSNNQIPFYNTYNNITHNNQNIPLNTVSNNQIQPIINDIPNIINTENKPKTPTQNIPSIDLNNNLSTSENKLSCNYCHKTFARKNALYRHINNSCKIAKEQNKEKQDIFEKLLLLETKNKQLEEEIKNKDKHLEECIKKINGENKIINYNTINNTTNNTINVINVVSHGEENLIEKKIGELLLLISTKRGFNVVEELISQVHFSSRYPEFQNIYIPDIKNKHAMVFDKVWKLKNLDDIIKDLYDTKSNYITDNKDVFFDHLNIKEKIVYQRWENVINDKTSANYKKYYSNMHNNVKLMMFNNRDMVIATKNNHIITL